MLVTKTINKKIDLLFVVDYLKQQTSNIIFLCRLFKMINIKIDLNFCAGYLRQLI
jgi:hypothetical protein